MVNAPELSAVDDEGGGAEDKEAEESAGEEGVEPIEEEPTDEADEGVAGEVDGEVDPSVDDSQGGDVSPEANEDPAEDRELPQEEDMDAESVAFANETAETTAMPVLTMPDDGFSEGAGSEKDTMVMSMEDLDLDRVTLDKAITQEITPDQLSDEAKTALGLPTLSMGEEDDGTADNTRPEKMEYHAPEASVEIQSPANLASHRENLEREREATEKLRMKYQRRDTSVLFSLSDLTAPSQTEKQKRDEAAIPLDIRAVAEEMRAAQASDDPFRQFDRATDRTTQPDEATKPVPVTISIPVVRRKRYKQFVFPLLAAMAAAGITAGLMIYMYGGSPVAPPPPPAQEVASAANPGPAPEGATKEGARTEATAPGKPNPAVVPNDAGSTETQKDAGAVAVAGDATKDSATEAAADGAPSPTLKAKIATRNEEKPKKVEVVASQSKRRKKSSSESTKSKPKERSKPAPKPRVEPEPEPKPKPKPKAKSSNDDINALLNGIRKDDKRKSSSADDNLPDKPGAGQIKRVVQRYQKQMNNCYKKGNPGGESVRVMAKVEITGDDGRVSKASVLTPPFSSNSVGTCIQGVFKDMNFGRFRRSNFTFRVPIYLQ